MDGRGSNGVLLTSGLVAGSGGSGGSSGGKDPVYEDGVYFYQGPNGSARRTWRIVVSPLSVDQNALLIQYKDQQSIWQSGQVYLARTT
jgi:hypothetical protein